VHVRPLFLPLLLYRQNSEVLCLAETSANTRQSTRHKLERHAVTFFAWYLIDDVLRGSTVCRAKRRTFSAINADHVCSITLSNSGGLSPPDFDLFPKLKKPLHGKSFRSIQKVSNEVTWVMRRINNEGDQTGIQDFPKRWTTVMKHNGDYIWRPVNVFCKINSFLKRKHTVCRTSEMTHVCIAMRHSRLSPLPTDLEDGTDRLSRNVGEYHSTLRNISEE
jgi:hypothetical protein